jgi:hypothetical protein
MVRNKLFCTRYDTLEETDPEMLCFIRTEIVGNVNAIPVHAKKDPERSRRLRLLD